MSNFKLDVAKCFSVSSSTYDEYAGIQKQTSQKLANIVSSCILSSSIESILDIGAGTGLTAISMIKYYPEAQYTLCDISEKMLSVAASKSLNNCSYLVVDAEQYSFPRYDLCVSNLAVQWFENLESFVRKVLNFSNAFAFTTILNTSFREYAHIFTTRGEDSPIHKFKTLDEVLTIVSGCGNMVCSLTRTYNKNFENGLAVARYFKNLGANASNFQSSNAVSILLSARKKIVLNYDVVYIIVKKR